MLAGCGGERRSIRNVKEAAAQSDSAAPSPFDSGGRSGRSSASGSGITGKLYDSPSHRPKSIVRHRSLQNGTAGEVADSNSRLHTGHRMAKLYHFEVLIRSSRHSERSEESCQPV